MRETAAETDLSMSDFTRYFDQNKLGRLYLSNDSCSCNVGLKDLYTLVSGWRVDRTTSVPLDDIIAVIVFGSAVHYPGVQEISSTRRRYLLFGDKVTVSKMVPIYPTDVDFLVITGRDLSSPGRVIKPVFVEDYYGGMSLKEYGIHLVNRGISQVLKGVCANDTVSISALREGVPIFFNGRFSNLTTQAGIRRETPRKIRWDTDAEGSLMGWIK